MATTVKHPQSNPKLVPSAGRRSTKTVARLPDVRSLRTQHGLSQALFARLLGVSLRTASSLESSSVMQGSSRRNVTQLIRLCEALSEAVKPVFVGRWLDQPNEMLSGLKPVEAMERGQLDLVWQVVEGLRSGQSL